MWNLEFLKDKEFRLNSDNLYVFENSSFGSSALIVVEKTKKIVFTKVGKTNAVLVNNTTFCTHGFCNYLVYNKFYWLGMELL